MNRFPLYLAALALLALPACDNAFDLDVENLNEPTPDVLRSEEGLERLAAGLYESFDLSRPKNFLWTSQVLHEAMGDAITASPGNNQMRWLSQVAQVTLADGTTITPPQGGRQHEEVARVNTRQLATDAAISQEWGALYFLNNQANLILQILDEGVELTADAAAKERGYRAWAHFWKGYAYARLGSLYEEALIIDTYGETNADYKPRQDVIAESDRQFDLAIEFADGFDTIRADVVPNLFVDSVVDKPTGASMQQAARTLQARNLLVNTYKDDLTTADYERIKGLTEQGLMSNEGAFIVKADGFATYPFVWMVFSSAWKGYGWHRVSERLLQDTQPGDLRVERHFSQSLTEDGVPQAQNTRGRGVAYNSSWAIEDHYATALGTGEDVRWWFVSAEENLLMLAEAELALGNAARAAALVDEVRAMQNAGLAPVDPSGDVWEQIRSERRMGLFLRGLPFYDARRWKVILPLAQGGGRENAHVITYDGVYHTDATFEYDYLPYWPVPDEELTFNKPGGDVGSGGDAN